MFIRFGLLLFLLLAGISVVSAQVFEPGYLVLSSGDTLRGEVENNFWNDPPTTVRLRSAAGSPAVAYPARRLRAVQLTSGRLLRRELLLIDFGASNNLNKLPGSLIIAQRSDTVLADVFVEGSASLLGIRLGDVKHFFVRREQRAYIELADRQYLAERDGRQQVVDGNNYRNQLLVYFGDCQSVVQALGKTAFMAEALSNLVQLYNQDCSAAKQPGRVVAARAVRHWAKVQVGPTLGMRFNDFRLHTSDAPGQERQTLENTQVDGRLHPQFGMFFDIVLGGRKWALHSAINRSNYGGTTPVASPNGDNAWKGTLEWRGSLTTVDFGVRHLRPLGATYQLVLGMGAQLPPFQSEKANMLYYGDGVSKRTVSGFSLPTRSYYPLSSFFSSSMLSLPYLEAGIKRDRLTLMLYARRYNRDAYSDPLVVAGVLDLYQSGTPFPYGYSYTGRLLSFALSLGFQLNANSDKQPLR
ncbi:hypothetical protein F0P96_15500 [Hymenobacter busanensis]|uniref:Uncharacterized protein n=1 Tax=Hymenobacter busanensis TaxID=2607656 RepID=A0A7L5A0H4_9BACT|nr:hypothetical protein [Hymenobacter busanensis]KAA9331636.1 hypothetical protein F0P96_15500 [Hymenobacter busanensis]QHJ08787.1 hypothetical protein GUY19_16435 [Hymenobacter busanensis]